MSSSIHLQTASHGSVTHNARENFSHSVVFTDEKNELQNNTKQAYEIYRKELAIRSKAYSDRTRQKLQKKTSTKLSAVVNLEKHHTLKDLEPIKNYLEKKLDTKVYQMAIHRDEGKLVSKEDGTELYSGKNFFKNLENNKLYYDRKYTKEIDLSKYEIVKNYHAHIEMLGIDSTGAAIRHHKMHKHFLKKLQDYTAQTLQMERTYGNKKRLDTHQYKQVGIEKQATKKILTAEIRKLRSELSGQGLAKKDFAKVNELNRELQERLKKKELLEKEMKEKLEQLKRELLKKDISLNEMKEKHKKDLEQKDYVFKKVVDDLQDVVENVLQKKIEDLSKKDVELAKIAKPKVVEKEVIKTVENPVNSALKAENAKLKNSLFKKENELKNKDISFNEMKQEIKEYEEQNKEIKNAFVKIHRAEKAKNSEVPNKFSSFLKYVATKFTEMKSKIASLRQENTQLKSKISTLEAQKSSKEYKSMSESNKSVSSEDMSVNSGKNIKMKVGISESEAEYQKAARAGAALSEEEKRRFLEEVRKASAEKKEDLGLSR